MAVAFDEYYFVFHRYPVHATTLRCLDDCGLHTMAFTCSRCGAAVAGKNIVFRFGKWSNLSHRIIQLILIVALTVWVLLTLAANFLFVVPLLFTLGLVCHFRPTGRFNFADVPRAARKFAKEKAQKEAVETAKTVEFYRNPFGPNK